MSKPRHELKFFINVSDYFSIKTRDDIVNNFINNGTYETLITKTDALISNYVKNDATAFYTFNEIFIFSFSMYLLIKHHFTVNVICYKFF